MVILTILMPNRARIFNNRTNYRAVNKQNVTQGNTGMNWIIHNDVTITSELSVTYITVLRTVLGILKIAEYK